MGLSVSAYSDPLYGSLPVYEGFRLKIPHASLSLYEEDYE